MINWDYWQWQRKRKRYSRPVSQGNGLVLIERVENEANSRIIGKISARIGDLESRIDMIEENATLPIMTAMESGNSRIAGELHELREAVEAGNAAVLSEFMRHEKEKEQLPLLKERHKELISILLSNSLLSYEEIREKLGVAKSSPRVYISELQKLGFPITKEEKEGKALVSVNEADREKARETAKKFGFDIQRSQQESGHFLSGRIMP